MESAGERGAIVLHRTLELVLTKLSTAGLSLPRVTGLLSEGDVQTSVSVRAAVTRRVGRPSKIATNEKLLPVAVGDSHETAVSDHGRTVVPDHGGTKTSECGARRSVRLNEWNQNSSSGALGAPPTSDMADDIECSSTRHDRAPQPAQPGGSEALGKCMSDQTWASLSSDGVCASHKVGLTASPRHTSSGPSHASSGLRGSLQTRSRQAESRKKRVVKPKVGETKPSEPRRGAKLVKKKSESVAIVGSSGDSGQSKRKRRRSGHEETPPVKRRKTANEVQLSTAYIAPILKAL